MPRFIVRAGDADQFADIAGEYDISQDRITFAEGRAIEKWTGRDFGELLDGRSIGAVQAMLAVAIKRAHPTFRYSRLDAMTFADFEAINDAANPDAEPGDPAEPDQLAAGADVPDPTEPAFTAG